MTQQLDALNAIEADTKQAIAFLIGDMVASGIEVLEKQALPHIKALRDQLQGGCNDRTFRDLYEQLANEYCKENYELYQRIAPLLGLKPFYGTCNKEQVIWARSQEEANNLPAGANIHKYIKLAISSPPTKDNEKE